jgi:hypothetical protein
MLSTYEVGLIVCRDELRKVLDSIAIKHSLLSFMKLQYHLKKPGNYATNSEFINKLSREIRADMLRTRNEAATTAEHID